MKKFAIILSILVLFLIVSVLLGETFTLSHLKAEYQGLKDWVDGHYFGSLSTYFFIYIFSTALSIPGATVLTVGAGALFGGWVGLLLASFASSLGALFAFLVVRILFKNGVQRRFARELQKVNQGVLREGWLYLLSLRLIPVFPFFLINILMALTPMKASIFYGVSQLAMLPATMVYIWAGTELDALQSMSDIISPPIFLLLISLGLLPFVGKWLVVFFQRRSFFKKHPRPQHFDYNLIVIGAGSAGLVSALIAKALQAKVLLIEKDKMGGDCLNTGCVPSKAFLKSAKLAHQIKGAERFGLQASVTVDFEKVMKNVHEMIATIEPNDSPARFESLGIDCKIGKAKFIDPYRVEVNGTVHAAEKIILATGARPKMMEISGIELVESYTSDTIWQLQALPNRLLVIGGGPIGVELSQAFLRLGSKVTMITRNTQILPQEDEDASLAIKKVLERDGLRMITSSKPKKFLDANHVAIIGETITTIEFDVVLIAIGREANSFGLGLDAVGVATHPNGMIETDENLRTQVPTIYACGDVRGPYQFTHASSHQAYVATANALLGSVFWRAKIDAQAMPHCTFSDPELARIGLTEKEALLTGISYEITTLPMSDVDRAIVEGQTEGWIKVLTPPGRDTILGATIIGANAGELLAQFAMAMRYGLGLKKILGVIHTYPTMMEANLKLAAKWQKNNQPQRLLRALNWWFRRRVL